jgi:hypothetical protein
VVDDVGQLLGEQPQVEGVQHRAHRRHGEVRLEVLLGVPQERPDPVALLHAEPGQRPGQPCCALPDLAYVACPDAVAVEGPHDAAA